MPRFSLHTPGSELLESAVAGEVTGLDAEMSPVTGVALHQPLMRPI
jgi:hypothetical protein